MPEFILIPGFDGAYRVSDYGFVESCYEPGKRGLKGAWRQLGRPLDSHGYPLAYLWDQSNQQRIRRLVHQIVAELFVPNTRPEADCVNHINGIKSDTGYRNLEWCTREENMQHAWQTGLCKPHKLTAGKVREIRAGTLNDTETSKIYGVSQPLITKIRARKLWKHV
jgi:hypothetical protein